MWCKFTPRFGDLYKKHITRAQAWARWSGNWCLVVASGMLGCWVRFLGGYKWKTVTPTMGQFEQEGRSALQMLDEVSQDQTFSRQLCHQWLRERVLPVSGDCRGINTIWQAWLFASGPSPDRDPPLPGLRLHAKTAELKTSALVQGVFTLASVAKYSTLCF